MMQQESLRPLILILSILLIVGGSVLGIWAIQNIRSASPEPTSAIVTEQTDALPISGEPTVLDLTTGESVTPSAFIPPVVIGLPRTAYSGFSTLLRQGVVSQTNWSLAPAEAVSITLRLTNSPTAYPVYATTFAPASRFDTIFPATTLDELMTLWQLDNGAKNSAEDGAEDSADDTQAAFTQMAVLSDTLPILTHLLGAPGDAVTGVADRDAAAALVWNEPGTMTLLPFDQLRPDLTVLAVDGQNPVENDQRFDESAYPLVHTLYADFDDADFNDVDFDEVEQQTRDAQTTEIIAELREMTGGGNRQADRLTVIAMTGVTAMVRETAAQMDRLGATWPADVIGPELSQADLTVISNEVPFVPGCETNTDPANLTFCSSPDYMAALDAVGVDLIGLTGNHQNDYGRADALTSLEIYAEAGLPVYGGGVNKEEAFAPLYIEHNGNRLAFLGANSYGPPFAWATDNGPGSAEFDLNIMSATIRNIKAGDRADLVLAELQYQESYDVQPLFDQRQNFRALTAAGADIVTGVQSHVPQAVEIENGKLILYGLGNLFFDQMWQQATREGLIVKHTIYQGRHISTQILTTLLYDFGQPRWTTDEERAALLERVYGASYWEIPEQQ